MLELEHIAICAKDTTALKDWYVKLFDFKVINFIDNASINKF